MVQLGHGFALCPGAMTPVAVGGSRPSHVAVVRNALDPAANANPAQDTARIVIELKCGMESPLNGG
jgi:hypothetical protein